MSESGNYTFALPYPAHLIYQGPLTENLLGIESAIQDVYSSFGDLSWFYEVETDSIGIGYSNTITGDYSYIFGSGNTITGDKSVIMGYQSSTAADDTLAFGWTAAAGAIRAISMGSHANASASESIAIGSYAVASGGNSIRIGSDGSLGAGTSSGTRSISIGVRSQATQDDSIALGFGAKAIQAEGLAFGLNADLTGGGLIAIGSGAKAVANGTSLGNGAYANGAEGTSIGRASLTEGLGATSLGGSAQATGNYSTALGYGSIASAVNAHVWGHNITNSVTGTFNFGADNITKAILNASGDLALYGTITASNLNITNWNTAYGWGNHAGLYELVNTCLKIDQTTPQSLINGIPTFVDLKFGDQSLGTPTYTTIGDWFDIVQSSGRISGMTITAHSPADGTIDVSSGTGIIKTTDALGATTKFFNYAGETGIATTDNDLNYVYAYYDSGTGTVKVATAIDRTLIHNYDQFTLGRAYVKGTDSTDIASSGTNIYNFNRRVHNMLVKRFGFAWASGSALSEAGTRGLAVTDGVWYIGNTEIDTAVHNSDTGGYTFDTYYYNPTTAAWVVTTGTTHMGNTEYNNTSTGTGLALIGGSKWANYWVYQCPKGNLYVVYGQSTYNSSSLAQATQSPTLLPDYISSYTRLIARITFQTGTTNFNFISSTLISPIGATSLSDHNNLGGLQGGTASQYYHQTAAQSGGDFSSQAWTNINIDSGAVDGTPIGASSASTGKFTTELVGANANFTDFPNAQAVFSQSDTGRTDTSICGILAEATAVNNGQNGVAGFFYGKAAGNRNGYGLYGEASVSNTNDSGSAIGMNFVSETAHVGGPNIAVWVNAANGGTNYSFYGSNGNIFNNGNLQIVGTLTGVTALSIASFGANWTNAGRTVADLGIVTTVDINGGSIDGATIGAASASTGKFTTVEASTSIKSASGATIDEFSIDGTMAGNSDTALPTEKAVVTYVAASLDAALLTKSIDVVQLYNHGIATNDTDTLTFAFVPSKIVIQFNYVAYHATTNQVASGQGNCFVIITGTNTFTSNTHFSAFQNFNGSMDGVGLGNDTTHIINIYSGYNGTNYGTSTCTGAWSTTNKRLTLTWTSSNMNDGATDFICTATAYK